ncbi:hypothetical protein ACFYKT_00220 [Cytobacillus sp. FJAT-53684]|uniref:IDEAL domain-containing protein n=1 Tax=Cytobacillus mangrovibacter TaxID=3299024 RepID=A0ABW6JUJ1_9BACI
MQKMKTDIDKLLDATKEIADDDFHYMIRLIEIDSLLEKTENW